MKKYIFIITIVFLLLGKDYCISQHLLLYGGKDNETYLGCVTCNKFDKESIWNKYGTYGSKYNKISIWNEYGTYGSKYNNYSPWNDYGKNPPMVVDENGDFYGYFSTNEFIKKRTKNEWLIDILDNWEWIMANFDEYVKNLKL